MSTPPSPPSGASAARRSAAPTARLDTLRPPKPTAEACVELALAVRERVGPHVDDVEVLVTRADQSAYAIENEDIVPALECATWSVAVRALRGGRIATAASTTREPDDAARALLGALASAQPTELTAFAEMETRDERGGASEEVWALVDDPAALRAMAVALRAGAWEAKPGVVLDGDVTASRTARALVTGRGGVAASLETAHSANLYLDMNDWAGRSARTPVTSDIPALGRTLAASLPARDVTVDEWLGGPGEVMAVLHPNLLESLFRALFVERVGLDRVLAGLSRAKEGDRVAHEAFSLFDNPIAHDSLAGHATDDEGVRGERRELVRGGVLTALLADRRSALRAGVEPTGHGRRVPILAESRAEAPVRVALGHLEMPAGTVEREALTSGRAIWVTELLALHSANKSTGAINNPILGGLALEDGVPVARLRPGAWSMTANFYELLLAAERTSRERFHTGSALLPWLAARVRVG
jgi:predicted Zn-dependent protease